MLERVVSIVFVLVGIVHLIPVVGVLGAERLASLYGVQDLGADLELLMRHRAVLFGIVAMALFIGAAVPACRWLAWWVGVISVGSFVALAQLYPSLEPSIARVVRVDWIALALLVIAGAMLLWVSLLRRGSAT